MRSLYSKLAVCTISAEGTREGNRMISQTFQALAEKSIPIYAAHISGEDSRLTNLIDSTSEYARIINRSNFKGNYLAQSSAVTSRLMSDLRRCIDVALFDGAENIIYMEGDKINFVDSIEALSMPLIDGSADITLARRSQAGWNKFPLAQRLVEGAANRYLASHTGFSKDTDFLYGPKGFNQRAAFLFEEYLANNWATLTAPVIAAALKGRRIVSVDCQGDPQENYMQKYPLILRSFPGQIAWRIQQCLPLRDAVEYVKSRNH